MSMNRRVWLRNSSMLAGATLLLGRESLAMPTVADGAGDSSAPDAESRARLASNENPYGPPKSARDAMMRAWDESNRYGPAGAPELRASLAAQWQVPADHILITQGSAEGLCASAAAFCAGGEVISAQPTYDQLLSYAETLGAKIVRVPLDANLSFDLPAIEKRVGPFTRMVFVVNPNNPTGTLVNADQLEGFTKRVSAKAPVFIDEAYHEYVEVPGHRSMMPLVTQGYDVVVSRTASKIHGMAGLRVGFLVARPDILARIAAYRQGFPNAMALRAAIAAVQDTEAQQFVRRQNAASRETIYRALDGLKRRYVPSHGNMVFFHTGRPISDVIQQFAERGIDVGRPFPPMLDWCRVSTGTPADTERFVGALRGIFA
ncbi:MAG: histidinol-phosphate transaminase [Gemmatimonadaceae bacterium]|nr:histidinol-phosphate transaminase [Gemmatimonadaceae bacterium]